MTETPQNNFSDALDEVEVRNRAVLAELAQTLEWSVGEFHLFLVRCNYSSLRSRLIEKLQEICPIRLQVVTLTEETQRLFTTIRAAVEAQGAPAPEAIVVTGFERVPDLDQLFTAADAAREEFRKQLPLPLLLWLDDAQFNRFKDQAPNFETWAPVDTPSFALATAPLIESLRQGMATLYAVAFDPQEMKLPRSVMAITQLGDLRRSELPQALQTLRERAIALPPDLAADLHLLQGIDAGAETEALDHFQACIAAWRGAIAPSGSAALGGRSPEAVPPADLKLALALYFLGRFQFHRIDILRRSDQSQYTDADWELARSPLEESLQRFDVANRPDMVAKIIRRLAGTLRRLQAWDDLESLARRALTLHQTYHMPDRVAMDYGFLAEVALHRGQWAEAKQLTEQALEIIRPLEARKRWAEGLYLSLLAKAEAQLGNGSTATALLERARNLGDRGHPTTYCVILEDLRQLYRQQKRYLEAFKLKQARLEVEKIAGIRAFVGAGRLGAQAKLIQESDDPAPEIYASGRQFDLKAILERIRRSDSKLTILHGPSGVGKSSLVNAGLIPTLQKKPIGYRMALPLVMRQYRDWAIALAELLEGERSPNPPTANPAADPDEAATLRAILATLRQCESRNQFPVLIFDQFEEFFFANPTPRQCRQFFEFLSDCLSIPCIYVILSLREDYIHYLLEASRTVQRHETPDNLLSRHIFSNILGKDILYAIGNFSPAQAKAIVADLTGRSRSYLAPDLVNALVQELAGELNEVRPIELQIVGSQLETEQVRSLAQYRKLGDEPKEALVSRYLQEVVDDCGEEYAQLAELVLYLLTDERGTRSLKTRSELKRELEVLLSALSIPPLAPGSAAGEGQEQPEDSLSYVLRILCSSGIVAYLPEDPEDRYQLVHDYIAEAIRSKKAPQLEALMAELAEERQKREQAELLQRQTAEQLKAAQQANRKAQQRLKVGTGVLMLSLVAALAAVPTAIWAIQTVGAKEKEVDQANQEIAAAEDRAKEIEGDANQREERAKEIERDANQRVEQARAEAEQIENTAAQQVKDAQQQVEAADQRLREADQEVEQAKANLADSEQAIRAAEARLEEAEGEAAEARQERAEAETALADAQSQREKVLAGTEIERAGVTALRQFGRGQELTSVLRAIEAGRRLKELAQDAPLNEYPAYSPIFSLQQMLYASAEQPLFQERNWLSGHQGWVYSVSFSPVRGATPEEFGQQVATASYDGTARIWQVYDLDGLIALGCDWVRDYLTYNSTVTDGDRALCNLPPKSSDSPASPSDEQASRPFERVTSVVRRWLGVG